MTELSKLLEPVKENFYVSALSEENLNTLNVVFGYHPLPDDTKFDVRMLIVENPINDDDQAVAWYGQDVIDNLILMGWNPDIHGYIIDLIFDLN